MHFYISGFLRRNTIAKDKTRLTAYFDTSAIDIGNTYKVNMAFVKFHKNKKVIYELSMDEEGAASVAWNTQGLPVNTTQTTDLYDVSWILNQWKEQGNPGQLKVEFNITKSARKQSRKLVLKTWNKLVNDSSRQQNGPVFLLAYFKDVSGKTNKLPSLLPGANITRYHKLRSGSPVSHCKHHSFRASFAELGLSDLYVKPTGPIDFSVCHGHCNANRSVDTRANYMTIHAWMLELARLVLSNPPVQKNLLKSCCVPTAYNGLNVWKKEPSGNLVKQLIAHLTASSCGCR